MPLRDPPPDLTWCIRCRKVIGPRGGWFGAECFCDQKPSRPLAGAHSVGTMQRRN